MKAREFQKNIYICFIDYTKTFDCVAHNKLWKILQEMENCSKFFRKILLLDHLTSLLRKLYVGQEGKVRNEHGTMDWFCWIWEKSMSRLYVVIPLI